MSEEKKEIKEIVKKMEECVNNLKEPSLGLIDKNADIDDQINELKKRLMAIERKVEDIRKTFVMDGELTWKDLMQTKVHEHRENFQNMKLWIDKFNIKQETLESVLHLLSKASLEGIGELSIEEVKLLIEFRDKDKGMRLGSEKEPQPSEYNPLVSEFAKDESEFPEERPLGKIAFYKCTNPNDCKYKIPEGCTLDTHIEDCSFKKELDKTAGGNLEDSINSINDHYDVKTNKRLGKKLWNPNIEQELKKDNSEKEPSNLTTVINGILKDPNLHKKIETYQKKYGMLSEEDLKKRFDNIFDNLETQPADSDDTCALCHEPLSSRFYKTIHSICFDRYGKQLKADFVKELQEIQRLIDQEKAPLFIIGKINIFIIKYSEDVKGEI